MRAYTEIYILFALNFSAVIIFFFQRSNFIKMEFTNFNSAITRQIGYNMYLFMDHIQLWQMSSVRDMINWFECEYNRFYQNCHKHSDHWMCHCFGVCADDSWQIRILWHFLRFLLYYSECFFIKSRTKNSVEKDMGRVKVASQLIFHTKHKF